VLPLARAAACRLLLQVSQLATDSMLNAETVKLYTGEDFERDTFEAKILDFQHHEWYSLASLTMLNVRRHVALTWFHRLFRFIYCTIARQLLPCNRVSACRFVFVL
jgi:ABC-type transport system involved in Fe-S cluster assembly fused permease/ATPase subunit